MATHILHHFVKNCYNYMQHNFDAENDKYDIIFGNHINID